MRVNNFLKLLVVCLLAYGLLWKVGVLQGPIVKWVMFGLVVVGSWIATIEPAPEDAASPREGSRRD